MLELDPASLAAIHDTLPFLFRFKIPLKLTAQQIIRPDKQANRDKKYSKFFFASGIDVFPELLLLLHAGLP
ncbi:MAG: hypothetical protein WC695_00480 [Candidatus Omnitrophota bacterium]